MWTISTTYGTLNNYNIGGTQCSLEELCQPYKHLNAILDIDILANKLAILSNIGDVG